MSPKQWFALLCVYISYLFFGASIFYQIEHSTELENRAAQLQERIAVNELLVKYASPNDQHIQSKLLATLSGYCDRPVTNHTLDEYPVDFEWTFFHSFWFSFIVCSTVGYGNSSPHDQPGQAFLIFYALIGLPLNGFVLAHLGKFFSKTFTRFYNRYNHHHSHIIEKFGMIGTIAMLLIPGIAFFIFIPACLFAYFEDWPYVRSVYYSFVTLTTIGFGDFVPTFQDGQARKFGTYFTFYQIFIVVWNFIGVGYFIMIIGFIAAGMHSKRIARLEHQLSMNIKETQHRIWTEVTKDVNFLRKILNEAHLMKWKPVYTDPMEKETCHPLHRRSSCPEIAMYREEFVNKSRKRAYSESCGRLSDSSTLTLYRSQSDGHLSRIDKEKTFEGSGSLSNTKDLLSNVLTALGSIRPINEDVHSCLEMHSCEAEQTDSLYEWTWDGNNAEQINDYVKKKKNRSSITSIFYPRLEVTKPSGDSTIQVEPEMRSESLNRSFLSRFNPFKERSMSEGGFRRNSKINQEGNVRKYLETTSKGRESRISLCQLSSENMELLQRTSIADLIRAIEGTSNVSVEDTPLLEDHKDVCKMKIRTASTTNIRRDSLRPVPNYTTIFKSQNISNDNYREPAMLPKPLPINVSSSNAPKRITKRIRSTSSSIPTVQEHYPTNEHEPTFHRTMSLRPHSPTGHSEALPQMPMITVQAPNDLRKNLLWHPEYQQDASTLQNKMRRRRADSN